MKKNFKAVYHHPSVRGITFCLLRDSKAGIAINSPFLPLLRRDRHIDLIVSLDFRLTCIVHIY